MDNHKALRAAVNGTQDTVQINRLDLAELLQEYDCLVAAGTTKRGKKEYPLDFLEAYDAMKNAGVRWRDGSTPAAAFTQWKARLKAGHLPAAIIAGAHRYAAWCKATRAEQVLMAQTFFGPQERFTSEYIVPRSDVARRSVQGTRQSPPQEAPEVRDARRTRWGINLPATQDDDGVIDAPY